jgi:hypothetical protein
MEVASLEVQVQLFDSLVSPVLGFCAEVWAPTLLRGAERPNDCLDNPLQRVQNLFMRRLGGGLRKSTSRHLMLREFGCRPLVRGWLQAAVGLWNRIQQLPAEHLLRVTVAESLALGGNVGSSWVSDFTAVLNLNPLEPCLRVACLTMVCPARSQPTLCCLLLTDGCMVVGVICPLTPALLPLIRFRAASTNSGLLLKVVLRSTL